MTKKGALWLISIIAVVFILIRGITGEGPRRSGVGELTVEPGNSVLYFKEQDFRIKGWDTGDCTFFFLPSYVDISEIDQSGSLSKIYSRDGSMLIKPLPGRIQDVLVISGEDGSRTAWKLGIFRSENLYTIDISLDGIRYYDISHDTYSEAAIDVYSPSGRSIYHANDARIKGRGNSSWVSSSPDHKNPYQLKLPHKAPLCGMKSADKWALIVDDPSKLRNKLSYDLAAHMDMEYAIESDWADLYINGEYLGNYLLCHEPDIGSGDLDIGDLTPLNRRFSEGAVIKETKDIKAYDYISGTDGISGGYLIEKNSYNRYADKKVGFRSGDDYFTVKSPDNASFEETAYIKAFVDGIDEAIREDTYAGSGRIDYYSFARQYLITELSLDPDAAFTSYYFYKKPAEDTIYAGPCWDFDGAYGRWTDPVYKDYTSGIFDVQDHIHDEAGYNALDWDRQLLENAGYREYVGSVFCEYIPIYDKLLTEDMDGYYHKLQKSSVMDHIRWEGYDGCESDIRNEYRHLKFFLYNRLKHMAKVYGGSIASPPPDIYDNTEHMLTFIYEDGTIKNMKVRDGAQMKPEDLPEYDASRYQGWRSDDEYHSLLSFYDPIFEDRTLVLEDQDP